jgi:putative transcriptional regulator
MPNDLRKPIRDARADIAAYLAGDESRIEVTTVHIPDDIDVKAVRENMALSQSQFARLFGFNLSVVQSWERRVNRKTPSRATRVLLTVLDRKPQAVLEALTEENDRS